MIDFSHLHVHDSLGSMQDATANIYKLFEKAKELGQNSMAITNHGTLASILDARKASKKTGVKYIPGLEAYFVNSIEERADLAKEKSKQKKEKRKHLILLAKNETGYRNLLRINYSGFSNYEYVPILGKVFPVIDWNTLEKYNEGIICLTACGSGPLAAEMFRCNEDGEWDEEQNHVNVIKVASRLKTIFGEDFYLEVQPHSLKKFQTNKKTNEIETDTNGKSLIAVDQTYINRKLLSVSRELDIPIVATCDVHYLTRADAKSHDMLMAINEKKPLSDPNRHRYEVEEFYVKSGEEVFEYFCNLFDKDIARELCESAVNVANKCENSSYIDSSEIHFPLFDTKSAEDYDKFKEWKAAQKFNGEVPLDHAYMRYKCVVAFKEKFGNLGVEERNIYKQRMIDEIKIYELKNFSSYMLITSGFISEAKNHGIRVGPGRGCLTGDAQVLTENGFKSLKDISVLDKVYSHTGNLRDVENTFVYPVSENLLEIKTNWGFGSIKLTKDHRVFAKKRTIAGRFRKYGNKMKKYNDIVGSPEWIRAEDLEVGDVIFTPFVNKKIKNLDDIDVIKYTDGIDISIINNKITYCVPKTNEFSTRVIHSMTGISRNTLKAIKRNSSVVKSNIRDRLQTYLDKYEKTIDDWIDLDNTQHKYINKNIAIDRDFLYFIGRWIGDGWYKESPQSNYIGIAFNSDDLVGIKKIEKYMNKLGFECHYNISKTRNLTQMYVYGKILPRLLKDLIPDYKNKSYSKHLPDLFRLLDRDNLCSLLNGLIDSDGSRSEKRVGIDTTSKRMALEVKEALLYLGIPSSVIVRKPYYRENYLCRESYKIRFNIYNKNMIYNNGYFSVISGIDECKEDYVYDIRVSKDHSYVTQNYSVHNSVGGSLVAYLLNIHDVDPLEYGLLFERFLNAEKTAFPDIDSDFSPDGRDWVEQFIINKYNARRVAHVSNLSTITPKVVIKDIARSLELGGSKTEAFKIANAITDIIPDDAKTFDQALAESEKLREYCDKYPELESYGRKLVGLEKVYSTHAAGIVISDIDLDTYAPLRCDKKGTVSVQYEKNRCEDVGLIKMDLLGLEHLKVIDATIKNAKDLGMECPEPNDMDLKDKDVWNMISKGHTLCVFQMGSDHMRHLCNRIKPQNIEDLSLVNALGRPSAAESREIYIARRDGRKKVTFDYDCLIEPLKETLGICVYEEQLAKLAKHVAGWDLKKADGLRKLTKLKGKDPALAKQLEEDFIRDGSKHTGLKSEDIESIWKKIVEPFAGYGFNKAHGIFYSFNGYHTAYYKYHYPAAFMAAVLKSEVEKSSSDENKLKIYKKEAERLGIKINVPDINKSLEYFSVVDNKTIVMGLVAVKGVGVKAVQNILETRREHEFVSFEDFLYRTNSRLVRKDVIQALAKAGCLDSIGVSRKFAFEHFATVRTKANKVMETASKSGKSSWEIFYKTNEYGEEGYKVQPTIKNENDWVVNVSRTEEWDKETILKAEAETLGEYISGGINDLYQGFFTGKGTITFNQIKKLANGTPVIIEAVIEKITESKTKTGKNKGDVYGTCELVDKNKNTTSMKVWSNTWCKIKEQIGPGKPIRATCRINVYKGSHMLVLNRLEAVG